jgi:hypothetical protein
MIDKNLHTLIPLDDFKAVLGIDDMEDGFYFASMRNKSSDFLHGKNSTALFQPPSLAAFCLVTSTFTIEQYCQRRLLRKKYFERIEFCVDLVLPLREYPVSKILALYAIWNGEIVEPDFYRVVPDCGSNEDFPYSIELSPAVARIGCKAVKAVYFAGYASKNIPADLSAACLELASWNMSRYRGRRVGMTGNIKGAGIQGEHFELSMPEKVRAFLEPYRRKTI